VVGPPAERRDAAVAPGSTIHLGRYIQEFTFRLSEGNVGRHTLARLDSLLCSIVGNRLTYKALTP
jgi:hypothetical protein